MEWNGMQWLGAIVCPMFSRVPLHGFWNLLRCALHLLVVAACLFGLWQVNHHYHLERVLHSPWPQLHGVWLPLVGLLIYALSWLTFGFWRLLGPKAPAAYFPDIEAAWNEARLALSRANIDVTEVPLYFILGRPSAGDDCLFSAASLQLAVPRTPVAADAPLHVYATRDAIFVSCSGASLLSEQARLFAEQDNVSAVARADSGRTVNLPGIPVHALAAATAANRSARRSAETPRGDKPLLQDETLLENFGSRLEYLCRLVSEVRRPYCSVNGLLVLAPASAVEGDAEASQIASLVQRDLQTARSALQVECPVYFIFCDLQQAPGAQDFLQQVPDRHRLMPLGQRLPMVPDVDPHEVAAMLEEGIDAFCRQRMPLSIYQLFRLETQSEGQGGVHGVFETNVALYRFLSFLRQGRKRLSRIVQRGAQSDFHSGPMVAGCYLAATGADPFREQAFVAGIFQALNESQNYVSWTAQALRDESTQRRMTVFGYFATIVLVVGVSLGLYWMPR